MTQQKLIPTVLWIFQTFSWETLEAEEKTDEKVFKTVLKKCLVLDCDFKGPDAKGEAYLDLRYAPNIKSKIPLDMTNISITAEVEILWLSFYKCPF